MTWWNRPGLSDREGVICDGAVRSGKTVCMTDGFFIWSMSRFDRQNFGICGRRIGSLRRNVTENLHCWLGGLFSITENRAENKLTVRYRGRENTYYLFGGVDESAYKQIQGITLAGALLDEVALYLLQKETITGEELMAYVNADKMRLEAPKEMDN